MDVFSTDTVEKIEELRVFLQVKKYWRLSPDEPVEHPKQKAYNYELLLSHWWEHILISLACVHRDAQKCLEDEDDGQSILGVKELNVVLDSIKIIKADLSHERYQLTL
jgi:hypothetical protein